MSKTNGAVKPLTHFETVSVDVVKKIAVEDLPTDRKFGVAIASVERRAKKNPLMPVPSRAPAGKKR